MQIILTKNYLFKYLYLNRQCTSYHHFLKVLIFCLCLTCYAVGTSTRGKKIAESIYQILDGVDWINRTVLTQLFKSETKPNSESYSDILVNSYLIYNAFCAGIVFSGSHPWFFGFTCRCLGFNSPVICFTFFIVSYISLVMRID